MGNEQGQSKISWGKIIAGAAIVAGAILVAPTLMAALPVAAASIGHAIAAAFATGGTAAATAGPGLVAALTGTVAHKIAGAALIGGGVAYFMGDKGRHESAAEQQMMQSDTNSFAMREDMRRMQALMAARMQAMGHAPAGMAGQQR